MMRSLLVEVGHTAARLDGELRQDYQRREAAAWQRSGESSHRPQVGVRMYWMLRSPANYAQLVRMQGNPRGTGLRPVPDV
jgi:hypothetical protein